MARTLNFGEANHETNSRNVQITELQWSKNTKHWTKDPGPWHMHYRAEKKRGEKDELKQKLRKCWTCISCIKDKDAQRQAYSYHQLIVWLITRNYQKCHQVLDETQLASCWDVFLSKPLYSVIFYLRGTRELSTSPWSAIGFKLSYTWFNAPLSCTHHTDRSWKPFIATHLQFKLQMFLCPFTDSRACQWGWHA